MWSFVGDLRIVWGFIKLLNILEFEQERRYMQLVNRFVLYNDYFYVYIYVYIEDN